MLDTELQLESERILIKHSCNEDNVEVYLKTFDLRESSSLKISKLKVIEVSYLE